jgi:hypothetical protein
MMDEGMSTLKTNTQERQAAIRNLLNGVDLSTKDADTAFLIELIAGVFGLFGIGYLYTGMTNTGAFRLIGGLIALTILYTLFGVCGGMVLIGLCFVPFIWFGQIAAAYFSANDLKQAIIAAKAGGGGGGYGNSYLESAANVSSNDINFGSARPSAGVYTPPTPPAPTNDFDFGSSSSSGAGTYTPPATPRSPEISFGTPPAPPAPSSPEINFGTPPAPTPSTPSTPEISFNNPPPAPRADSDDEGEDFDPNDLTKKV